MSKKKKSKSKGRYFNDYYGNSKKSKKSGGKKSAYKKPTMKSVKATLDKKDAKENRRIVKSPVDVPAKFLKNRRRCNHAGTNSTVAEYKAMTPNWAAYTPALERAVALFGDKVHVCNDCFDVVFDRDTVAATDANNAIMTLYAACNIAVANKRLKEDEVKEIAKLKEGLENFQVVIDILTHIEEASSKAAESQDSGTASLNRNDAAPFMA